MAATFPFDTSASLLRRTLRANAVFSAASGLACIAFARPLAGFLGAGEPLVLAALGAGVAAYALLLWRNAAREQINETEAILAAVLDAAWVAGSAALIAAGPLATGGNWLVAAVADVVLVFAVLEVLGVRAIRRGLRHA